MRLTLIKIIAFFAAFLFCQGAILPWAISNNFMPLWADIILISLIIVIWLIIIEHVAMKCIKELWKDYE